ncbi:uncharacterized protein LOC111102776 [Crassostrea virginica]
MDLYTTKWIQFCPGLLFFHILTKFPLMVSSTGCMASTDTAKIVLECPQTRSAWEEAATNKNCSSIQNSCSSFVYHCVMNTWQNQTIEVCAPMQLILGKNCAEYNFLGAKVQRNSKVKCTKCPSVYSSTEAFRYQECYNHAITITKSEVTTYSFAETTTKKNIPSTFPYRPEYLIQNKVADCCGSFGYIIFGVLLAFVSF